MFVNYSKALSYTSFQITNRAPHADSDFKFMSEKPDAELYGERYASLKLNYYKYFENFSRNPIVSDSSSDDSRGVKRNRKYDRYSIDSSSDQGSQKDDEGEGDSLIYEFGNNYTVEDFEYVPVGED